MRGNSPPHESPVLRFSKATLRYGARTLWSDLTIEVQRGEFLTVLGPNGAGKSSLAQVALGLRTLSSGSVRLLGEKPRRTRHRVGYVAQNIHVDTMTPLLGKDFVGLGYDGHRFGFSGLRHRRRNQAVDAVLDSVSATQLANRPVGQLSGGELARLRLAQALVCDPEVLICDEPLANLDVASQTVISEQIAHQQQQHGTTVLFITHEINPVLPFTQRVLHIALGGYRMGTVPDIMTSETLTSLYGAPIEVITVRGALVVVGAEHATSSSVEQKS